MAIPPVYISGNPLFMQPAPGDTQICYTAQDYRFMLSMIYPIGGTIKDGDFKVTQNGNGDNTVNVAPGVAIIPGTTVTRQGSYFVQNPATVNIQPPTPPVANQRYDLVTIGVEDGQVTATHQYRW